MSKSEKSKTRVEDTDEELTDEEIVVGKYFGFRHKGLTVFFLFFSFIFIYSSDSYEKDVELRKQPSTSKKGRHAKAAKGLGEEFITSFSGFEKKGLYCF